ncbi:S24 family peptidase [Herbaspirillum sp. RV1423]|uniref:S24 family peptidase n=1 Tax=Herbaspirillum sp. RV1423 TaxID=1443993 RepID=UPI001E36578A|nr:S24 family peptidase [Herbaspirillum sp. RV1423]
MHEHRRKRLLVLIADQYRGDRKSFCDASGLSESRLAQLLSTTYRHGQGFGEKAARALENRLDLDVLYFDLLAISESASRQDYQQHAKGDACDEDTVHVRQVNLKLTAGSVRFKMEDAGPDKPALCLHRSWLKARNLSADKLIATTVNGASMSPRLHDGDVVVVNMGDVELSDGAVCLINYLGQAVIKRMALDFGRWYMTSDNTSRKHYPRQEFDEKSCVVIGRIIILTSERV